MNILLISPPGNYESLKTNLINHPSVIVEIWDELRFLSLIINNPMAFDFILFDRHWNTDAINIDHTIFHFRQILLKKNPSVQFYLLGKPIQTLSSFCFITQRSLIEKLD